MNFNDQIRRIERFEQKLNEAKESNDYDFIEYYSHRLEVLKEELENSRN